ncbi:MULTISPECIES: hypothetical protein [Rhizobium]|nr:hypothetical protein [Rhizobium miluonense]
MTYVEHEEPLAEPVGFKGNSVQEIIAGCVGMVDRHIASGARAFQFGG